MSNKKLTLDLLLKLTEKASAPLKKITGGSQRAARVLNETKDQLKALQRQQKDVSSFTKLHQATKASRVQFSSAAETVKRLKEQYDATDEPSRKLTREFELAAKKASQLKNKHIGNQRALKGLRTELESAGINISELGRHEKTLGKNISRTTEALERQKRQLKQIGSIKAAAGNVAGAAGNVRQQTGRLATQGAVAGAVGGYFFKTQFLDKAAQFETYQTTLETVEGSAKKAKEAMGWVADFAAKTPFELDQVTEAYVKLKAFGLDPTNGLLETLGNTGSAMGKPMMQAVEAIADAVTGENERLKEFGINAGKVSGKIIYEYTDKFGEQRKKVVDASNREMIQSTLTAIWNEKYAGAMDKQSKTWRGMMSNLSDQWTRFTVMVMDAGLFDWMKGKLGGLLDKLNEMAADGRLQAWAGKIGTKLVAFAEGAWKVGSAISTVTSTIANAVGGWENFFYLLIAIKLGPLALGIAGLSSTLFTLGKTALPLVITGLKWVAALAIANPIGALVAVVIGAAAAIYKYWEPIKEFFGGLWDSIMGNDAKSSPSKKISQQLKNATAGVALTTAALPAAAVQFDNQAPLASFDSQAGGGVHVGQIVVQATPGMDEQALARLVAAEVKKLEQQKQASRRSSLSDFD